MTTASIIPILLVDIIGSILMVVIALLCLYKAKVLRRLDPDNGVFLYLLWISSGFSIFAISRSVGHILRQFMILSQNPDYWMSISPYSGSVNTASFMLVGLITLFFNQSWNINEKILSGRKKLEETHVKLMDLNQTLENKVVERTERLTSSEHKCRRIFEQSLDTIIVTSADFKIQEINHAGSELTGYPLDEILNQNLPIEKLFSNPLEWEKIKNKIAENEFILNEEAEFFRPDRSRILILMTGGIDYGAFGCAKSFHFIIKNINDKRQMERQIAQTDKLAAIGELSAGIAHEINNPLGIILGYTQLLLKEAPEKYGEDLKIIEKHVKNCKVVVSDLLAFSRKGSTSMSVINVNRIVEGVLKFLANHSDFRNIDLAFAPSAQEGMDIHGNEQELAQVMVNLLINASHAVDGKGRVEISAAKENDHINIIFKDDGKGIKKEDLPKIFDPFFTTKPVGQGTGLGLSVGYGIIKRHRGYIDVESTPGKGSVFTIKLPRAETTA